MSSANSPGALLAEVYILNGHNATSFRSALTIPPSPSNPLTTTQAQYYRDPDQLDNYLKYNTFLPYINNELPDALNRTYARNLATLSHLVLVLFSKDVTVVPKESAWFGSFATPDPDDDDAHSQDEKTIVPMRLQPLYQHDWIGLRTLDETGRVVLETCEGPHMHISDECWRPLVERYVGGFVSYDYDRAGETVFRVQD